MFPITFWSAANTRHNFMGPGVAIPRQEERVGLSFFGREAVMAIQTDAFLQVGVHPIGSLN